MTWMPSVSGRAIDLIEPRVDQVDFRDMAHALAHVNRYGGHGMVQVSVALHLLIGLDLCPEALKPYWLLHDAHEERLGDIATPVMQALEAQAEAIIPGGSKLLRATVVEFKRKHDEAIHAAAGLPMPTPAIRRAIADIDLRALTVEHRDFHRPSARAWAHELLGLKPERSIRKFQAPDKIADQLLSRFELYLPALRAGAPARLFEVA